MSNAVGNKARFLLKMKEAGVNVPAFFVLDGSPEDEEAFFGKIKLNVPKAKYFAVRSSADCEDSDKKSYAGYFYTALGVEVDSLILEIKKVVESYEGGEGSVVVQEFIPSDKGGVLFSSTDDDQVVINSNFGLCDSVVKGNKCDEYVVSKQGEILSKEIPKGKEALVFVNGLIEKREHKNESLSKKEIKSLLQMASKIELLFGAPQDIEWCFFNDVLYVLQSRPITKNISNKEVLYFDSANIAESYSGIVLPLTCSFASSVYSSVYRELLISSGVSKKKVEKHNKVFNNMLGFFYGRVYYNMNNWYKMMAFLPGYNRNKLNLEEMITSNLSGSVGRDIYPSLWLKIKYPFLLIFKIAFFPLIIGRFQRKVRHHIKDVRKMAISDFSLDQCKNLYKDLNFNLLKGWHRTAENDFMVMTYFSLVKKMNPGEDFKKIIKFSSESTKQIKLLKDIATKFKSGPELVWVGIENGDEGVFRQGLRQDHFLEEELEYYFSKYSGRFANELKLESSDIETDFKNFANLIKLYSETNIDNLGVGNNDDVLNHSSKRSFLNRFVLSKFKKYSSQREELRLLRSNAFGVVRKIFSRIGEIYYQEGLLENKNDVFYLDIDEIFSTAKKRAMKLSNLVQHRKEEYAQYRGVTPPNCFAIKKGESPQLVERKTKNVKVLQGRPCAPGKIKGRVRVFKDFAVPDVVDFDIIVADRTDPGWTALIGVAKGMIIEHGGILSHAAIVSRELGLPTVIGVSGATDVLKSGQTVELDGTSGVINIVDF